MFMGMPFLRICWLWSSLAKGTSVTMDLIQNNPYRLLGVFANAPTKERVASQTKLKAFLKVGKSVNYPLDLPELLAPIERTAESVATAEAQIALPAEQMAFAQFWFVKSSALDDIAFNHLFAGSLQDATRIWEKKADWSSLQNRIVCALLRKDYALACACAETLYKEHTKLFVKAVVGEGMALEAEGLAFSFLDALTAELGVGKVLECVSDPAWKAHLSAAAVEPLIEKLLSGVEDAKAKRKQGAKASLQAGTALHKMAVPLLKQLGNLLGKDDMRYQQTADKIGLEVLQCGITYYNESDDDDAAHKAMPLQRKAQRIVVGKMAKDRCKENVDILKRIIANLPPAEVLAEGKAIRDALRKFCRLPDKIDHAITLLNETKPHLQSIKAKLGAGNEYYLKVSTDVVGNALHNVIEEVNEAQESAKRPRTPLNLPYHRASLLPSVSIDLFFTLSEACREAWKAILLMDTFDMNSDFKSERYNENRTILKGLCEKLQVPTSPKLSTPTVHPGNNATSSSRVNNGAKALSGTSTSSFSSTPASTKRTNKGVSPDVERSYRSSSSDDGCVWGLALVIGGAFIGGCFGDTEGVIFGAIFGFSIWAKAQN